MCGRFVADATTEWFSIFALTHIFSTSKMHQVEITLEWNYQTHTVCTWVQCNAAVGICISFIFILFFFFLVLVLYCWLFLFGGRWRWRVHTLSALRVSTSSRQWMMMTIQKYSVGFLSHLLNYSHWWSIVLHTKYIYAKSVDFEWKKKKNWSELCRVIVLVSEDRERETRKSNKFSKWMWTWTWRYYVQSTRLEQSYSIFFTMSEISAESNC